MKNIEDLTQWCLKNRRGNAFKDWKEWQIRSHLLDAFKNRTLYVDYDNETGNICGVITGEQIFHISQILTTDRKSLGKLLKDLYFNTVGFRYKAYRQNKQKEVYYNKPEQLLKRLKLN